MQWLAPQASKPNGLGAGQERVKTLDEALEIRRPDAPQGHRHIKFEWSMPNGGS